jgi:hypothetical protein
MSKARLMTVRRMAKGELRVFVDGLPLAGVISSSIECIGFGRSNLVVKISGREMRLDDEAGPEQ